MRRVFETILVIDLDSVIYRQQSRTGKSQILGVFRDMEVGLKTLLICQLLLTSHGVSLHEVEQVMFSCRLPEDQRRSILGQRGVHTSAHPRQAHTHQP
jgi:hypothetical protein